MRYDPDQPRQDDGKFGSGGGGDNNDGSGKGNKDKGKSKDNSPKNKKQITLPSKEYGKVVHNIDTKFANNIPENGSIFVDNDLYLFTCDKEENKILFYDKIQIDGNENFIKDLD
jgi:hypothetical protein